MHPRLHLLELRVGKKTAVLHPRDLDRSIIIMRFLSAKLVIIGTGCAGLTKESRKAVTHSTSDVKEERLARAA